MDKPTLVDADMKAGEALLKKLDKIKFDVKAAFWFYMPDSEEWRLIFASPAVDKKGPKEAYEKVQSQLPELQQELEQDYELSLQNISLVSPNDDLVKLLKTAIKTGPSISHIRFARNVINNVFIEDAYIYRVV
jgi:hypothetical protein